MKTVFISCFTRFFVAAMFYFFLNFAGGPLHGADPAGYFAGPVYRGICDASGSAMVDESLMVCASDENNILKVYDLKRGGYPVARFDMTDFLDLKTDRIETDIEAAAPLGGRIYWITSHSRSGGGQKEKDRNRLFAVQVNRNGNVVSLDAVGQPYRKLLNDFEDSETLKTLGITAAMKIPAKELGGLNIEGLTGTPDGKLLVGLRGPLSQNKAILIPIDNPEEMMFEGARAEVGEPILMDLGGLGIRAIEYDPVGKKYWIAAGAAVSKGANALYGWSGSPTEAPRAVPGIDFWGYNPEAIIINAAGAQGYAFVVSDDGSWSIEGCDCKDLREVDKKRFRSIWVKLP